MSDSLAYSEGSTGVQFTVEFNRPGSVDLVAELGLILIEHFIDTNNHLTLNGTSYLVKGSYVFPSDPQETTNITASKLTCLCGDVQGDRCAGVCSRILSYIRTQENLVHLGV